MSVVYVVWMYVVVFAVIGALRGWAKEILVIFSVILALAVNHVMRRYIPLINTLPDDSSSLFWIRGLILLVLVYFGYQTVISVARLASKAGRDKLQDSLFGAVLGGLNGYLVAGSLVFYLVQANYPYPNIVSPPVLGSPQAETIAYMMQYLPPNFLGEPGIYFAVIISFIFVIVVFI
jgi:hypothetical protein